MAVKPREYSAYAKWLHWTIALAIGLQYLLAEAAVRAWEAGREADVIAHMGNHKSLGMTLFLLALLRLLWRNTSTRPALPAETPAWQILFSRLNHYALYVLLIGLPLTGWLGSAAAGYGVNWFGLFELPNPIGPSEAIAEMYSEWHQALWLALQALLALHVLAAIKHGLWNSDGVLGSMWSSRIILLGALSLLAGWVIVQSAARHWPVQEPEQVGWQIDYSQSSIEMSYRDGQVARHTEYGEWAVEVQFDEEALDSAFVDLTVDVNSLAAVLTKNASLEYIPQQFASAKFRAEGVEQRGDLYLASGIATLQGLSQPMTLNFKYAERDGAKVLVGFARVIGERWQVTGDLPPESEWLSVDFDISLTIVAQ